MHTRYTDQGEIGRGGMGVVLRVFDEDVRRNLAMKVLRAGGRDEPARPDGASLGRL
ncbi:MAG: hypothetical protein HC859_08740 [Bacteroidia bacterium]|nr:hypothetical protein [Bacteroidia bacterium]